MPTAALNGLGAPTDADTHLFGAQTVYADGYSIPLGRQVPGGGHPIILTGIGLYVSGYGGARTVSLQYGGASTAAFTVGAAGSAQYTGARPINGAAFANGGLARVGYTANGSQVYGRAPSAGQTVVSSSAGNVPGAALAGYIDYAQAPSEPRAVTISNGAAPGSVLIDYLAPADTGGIPINRYKIYWTTDPNAGTYPHSVTAPAGLVTISGLTPGTTYYFLVCAQNNVTDYFGVDGPYGTRVQATILGGGYGMVGGSVKSTVLYGMAGGVVKPIIPYGMVGGVVKPLL